MPRFTAAASAPLLEFLRGKLPGWKAETLRQRLRNDLVLVDGKAVRVASAMLAAGQTVEILAAPARVETFFPPALGEPPVPVLYADDALVAVNKPSGLLSVASERERSLTAIRLMREWLTDDTLHAAHRLDRDASGVLLLARGAPVKKRLAADWAKFDKTYLAVLDGVPAEREGSVDVPLWEDRGLFVRTGRGEAALTHYRILRTGGGRSLAEIRLGTGRKHQIRVHMAHIGCPIVGDRRYGGGKAGRLALHAWRLRLLHPADGREVTLTAPVPEEFSRMMKAGKRARRLTATPRESN